MYKLKHMKDKLITAIGEQIDGNLEAVNSGELGDAIDMVKGKVELAVLCERANVPIISSMGAGNKLDPCGFKVSDIYKTSVCPLARVMRTELKKRGVKSLKVVYSEEKPISREIQPSEKMHYVPASIAFIPSVVGLIIAGEVIKDLIR